MLVRMVTCRAFFWRLCAFIYITAYEAFPFYRFFAFPDSTLFNLFQVCFEAFAVALFHFGDGAEMFCNF